MKQPGLACVFGLMLVGAACAPDSVTAPASAPAASVIRDGEGREVRQPLFVVDGRIMAADELRQVAPADILDIKVLKGEAAVHAYGAPGVNGVLLITTKPGRAGI
ncbi:MAG TPA: hypothetical protein VEX86_22985 [Longimicrobium sp.]|nr:hypothetical protein [Longimicrobium sp.]